MGKKKIENDVSRLKRELSDVKTLLSDFYSSQITVNCHVTSQMEQMKLQTDKMKPITRKLKFVVEKYKEQKVQLDLLIRLLNGRLTDCKCSCGRKMNVISFERKMENEDLQSEDKKDEANDTMEIPKASTLVNEPEFNKSIFENFTKQQDLYSTFTLEKQSEALELDEETGNYFRAIHDRRPFISTQSLRYSPESINESSHYDDEYAESDQATGETGSVVSEDVFDYEDFSNVNKPAFSYTRAQRTRKNVRMGNTPYQIQRLDSNGQCQIISEESDPDDKWAEILRKEDTKMWSFPIMLPSEMSGIIIRFRIQAVGLKDKIRLELHVPHWLKENKAAILPISLQVHVELRSMFGQLIGEKRHKFTIKRLHGPAQPNSLDVSTKQCNQNDFPRISITFLN